MNKSEKTENDRTRSMVFKSLEDKSKTIFTRDADIFANVQGALREIVDLLLLGFIDILSLVIFSKSV